jgi:hypothetical protein
LFWFSLRGLFETFLILITESINILQYMHIGLSVNHTLFWLDLKKLNFVQEFSKKPQINNLMKILSMGEELFGKDGQTDRY